MLNEVEQQLIARGLFFHKFKQLPISRIKAHFDNVINVLIECRDISENVLKLPRNPDKAHLVPVQLKRRLEYKSTHLEQFIRPQLCLDALKYLKENNKFYEEIEIEENFMDNLEEGEDVESEIESQAKEREEEEMEPSDAMEKENIDSQNDDDENSTILKSVR